MAQLRRALPALFAFAHLVSADREEAVGLLRELMGSLAHVEPGADDARYGQAALCVVARGLEELLARSPERRLETLDQILRSDITRPLDLHRLGAVEDPLRIHALLWELKRTCLTATLACMPPSLRLSFVLTDVLGYAPAAAAEILGIRESAFRVRLTRARKRLEDFLTPRCSHVDAQNPCTCSGRLMIALEAKFVRPPVNPAELPVEGHDAGGPRRDMGALYRGLPVVRPLAAELEAMLTGLTG